MSTEQEIVTAEELHRYRNDVIFHDLVMRFRGYVDGGLGKFEDIIAAANFGRKIHFANENCDYEAVIRSLPVPSEPSGEDAKPRRATDPLDYMNALTKWPDPPPMDDRWIKKLAAACEMISDRDTALRELAEVAKKWHRAPIVEIADEAAHEFEGWLSRHSGLLDGEPTKENEA